VAARHGVDQLGYELKLVSGEVIAVDQFDAGRTPPLDAREISPSSSQPSSG
jgi:hypothetical protein